MIGIPSYKATGCGCGGGGGTLSAAPCGCGSSECASCQGQGIVRPRFFAGQLLTEDDLQLLTDYVGHKNRLHNRHLFGAGVVCGLEVTCHPCGDGRVIVYPGYALDCCGNDLTLACAATLDITAMVRDLRRDQLGGYDCGDPCPDPATDTRTQAQQQQAANAVGQGGVVPPPPPPFRYCLYLRYCEQPSDPVMPYSTGEDCGQLACEPTRIQEGVKFELRCRPMGDASNPLLERLCECVGDLNQFRRVLEALDNLDNRTVLAQSALESDNVVFSDEHVGLLWRDKGPALQRELINFQAQRRPSSKIPPELITSVREAALLFNRFNALPSERQAAFRDNKDFSVALDTVETNIATAVTFATDSIAYYNKVRDWLIERLCKAPFQTDCTLRQKVYTMTLPEFNQGNRNAAKIIAGGNQQLTEAFINFLRDCICRVLNPACMPCKDAGVLLACLEVEDCNVVKVCNLERTFVLSPAAVRYWLPPLQLLGNLVERLCCDPLEKLFRRTHDDSNLSINNLNMGNLLSDEVQRILQDSLCITSEDQIGPLTAALNAWLKPKDKQSHLTSTTPYVGKEASPARAEEAKQPQSITTATDAQELKASTPVPTPAVRRGRTALTKKEEKKLADETATTKSAETPEDTVAIIERAKINGAKTDSGLKNDLKGGQK